MTTLLKIDSLIAIFFTVCYAYQLFYILVSVVRKPRTFTKCQEHRFAVMISARNEEGVIGNLIESISKQTYPGDLIDVYVVADNCTDGTAAAAAAAGAIVHKRFNREKVGKGYALEFLFDKVRADRGNEYYDGFFIIDADNLLDSRYIEEMNKAMSSGYRIITSYRNSKNYSSNWISAGYALWFLREARNLNNARMILGTSCAVSGTGFLIHKDIINRQGGWKYFLLTEDIEFTIDNILHGEKVGYCHSAVLYDEQPETFGQSWHQRMRWAKGFIQVFSQYGRGMLRGIYRKCNFSCYDMTMNIMPAFILTIIALGVNGVAVAIAALEESPLLPSLLQSLLGGLVGTYIMLFVVGLITGICEWKQIRCPLAKKIAYFFTFPIFMLTYIPISVCALFMRVEWKPIKHSVSLSIADMNSQA